MSDRKLIQVYIVDDHRMIVEGIRMLLSSSETIQITGHASSGEECLSFLESNQQVDVVLMDINMPGISGLELCAILKLKFPQIKVLALSTFDQMSFITKMIDHGALGYILKNVGANELEGAIHQVHSGNMYFSDEIRNQFYNARTNSTEEKLPVLTPREKEVLILITQGYTNPAIAEKLFVSLSTIESHRKNLYSKLKVRNTATLIRFALDNNLINTA